MYDKLIGAYHLGSQGSNHWTLVVRQSNYLCFIINVVNVNVLTGVGAKIQQNNICDRISENGSKSHMKSIVIQHVFNYISTYAYAFSGYLLYNFNNLSIKFHVML